MKELFFNIMAISFFTSCFIICWIIIRKLINKKFSYKINRLIWLAIALRLIFCISIPVPSFSRQIEINSQEDNLSYKTSTVTNNITDSFKPNTATNKLISKTTSIIRENSTPIISLPNKVLDIIITIWIIGFIIRLFKQILSYIILCKKVREGESASPRIQKVYEACSRNFNYKYHINIIILDKVTSPFILGFFNKTIVLPKIYYTDLELNYIFNHEIVHGMKNDILYKFICILASCIHWFNPFSYLLVKYAEKDLEYNCDLEVIKNKNIFYRKNYCISILKLMEKEKNNNKYYNSVLLINNFSQNKRAVKARLENILYMKKKKNSKLIMSIIIVALLLSTSAITFVSIKSPSFFERVIYGDIKVLTTDTKDYGQFYEFPTYSTFKIFPQNIDTSMINDYYYFYQDTLFDPTCQVYLSCSYDEATYKAEVERLSSIYTKHEDESKHVIYDTENYNYPAYVTIDANNHCYEYALLTGENEIVYVFLCFILNEDDIVFKSDYLPKNYEKESTDEKNSKGYTIYYYYKENGDGSWYEN